MGRHSAVKQQVSSAALADYYSASQLRNDRWTALKYAAHELVSSADRPKTSAIEKARDLLDTLEPIETYWSFPGRRGVANLIELLVRRDYGAFSDDVDRIADSLVNGSYRRAEGDLDNDDDQTKAVRKPFFEVLVVENNTSESEEAERDALRALRRPDDAFIYETVFVNTFEDALIAILFNHNIQSVVVRYDFAYKSKNSLKVLQRILSRVNKDYANISREEHGPELCRAIRRVRPELDVYLVTDRSVEEIAGQDLGGCSRVFYNREDYLELHLNLLRGIASRFNTPFFTALKQYSKQPTGVFHAMPISRGKSITRSNWIRDMVEFYGMNIFLAETSATSGGLDSLLDPHGPIKKAQELASRAFGSKHTFFATNGTSTCNKIVVQAVVRPGDIVLVDRDCHKSHHYGMVLAGAHVVYLDSYPLSEYSMYGAVPLKEIKHKLLELKKAGKLHRVRMLLLTNCTFDGLIYNVERVMEECLAIKPDLVFLWDEAWFAFARFGPTYRQRTAMHAAASLAERFADPRHREAYAKQKIDYSKMSDEDLLKTRLVPDPAKARVRVYATQSTHKTLTSLRQGSMIHVYDQDFKGEIEASFHEAYMTHTSTSPNYQIIASLDVGRRQVELEGFELVQKQVEAAMAVRKSIAQHPILSKYFHVLTVKDMIPAEYRESGVETYWDPEHGWNDAWDAWEKDEFALDATRITLAIGGTGVDGDTFKNTVLMDKFGIQINKTSRNTVLFMTNIGTTRSSIAYLIEVLVQIARDLDAEQDYANTTERKVFQKKVHALTKELPPLPDFSRFHATFAPQDGTNTTEGDIRSAFFLSYDEAKCEYAPLNGRSMDKAMDEGREFVSTSFVIPYPPGFPILVPGQVISHEILGFMRALDVKEIHGFRADLGLRVFTQAALDQRAADQVRAADLVKSKK